MNQTSAKTWMLSISVAILLGAALMSAAGSALHQARETAAIASGNLKLVKLEPIVIGRPAMVRDRAAKSL